MRKRTIKIYGGMTGEFEIVKTNAPDEVIRQELSNYGCAEKPYGYLLERGYDVELIGCHYDDESVENIGIDKYFDLYEFI